MARPYLARLVYPDLPLSNLDHSGRWPLSHDGSHVSPCPVCGARSKTWRSLKMGDDSSSKFDKPPKFPYPYIEFECGGIYRETSDKPGFWSGMCGMVGLIRQQWLEFVS